MEGKEREAVGFAASLETREAEVLKERQVQEVLARLARGESVLQVAREMGIDRKTVRGWRRQGGWVPRSRGHRRLGLDVHADWLRGRAPEVEYNCAVLLRELRAQGFAGSVAQVHRFVRPLREAVRQKVRATIRFETGPGQQAQVDFGQRRVWIRERQVPAHVFVFTLGYSRRMYVTAFEHERLDAVLAGHEQAFTHFGGVPLQVVVDNAKAAVLDRPDRRQVIWNPVYADFAAYWGFSPWAHWPYRPQTKGKVESNIGYVKKNALAGKRFGSWTHLNAWLFEWATTIADCRIHGTTHERPIDRFPAERLTPLGSRPGYVRERVKVRIVPTDALVAIGGSRYSVPVRYVGAQVRIRETPADYEIVHEGEVIARHPRAGRHQVVMDPAHYAGLLRLPRTAPLPDPPRYDPGYPAEANVEIRDLAVYAALAGEGAAA